MVIRDRISPDISEFLRYLAAHKEVENGLPSLKKLSVELGVSVASLREQLEVARALGLVEVKPRLGTKRRDYSFTPAIRQSLGYALALNNEHFRKYSELRNHVEAAFWHEAVGKLTEEDKNELRDLITRAFKKLQGSPIRVPHEEHRTLHLMIYSRLENPFVTGILEAYWDAYENVGLNVFTGGYEYLEEVWRYHQQMVEAICNGKHDEGYNALIAHTDLLYHRP
ncbi:MAG TPA: FCD domain-containing protein [Anaerolineales bacterium]|nr:FCD domain-containing protein [Anaerolineales bacterium]